MLPTLLPSGLPRLGALLVACLAMATATPGCVECEDQLDVHHCVNETGRCDPSTKPTFTWDAQNLTALWPELTRLMGDVEPGLHGHAPWSASQADAFWQFYGVPLDQPDKQVLLRHQGETYHVRVQAC